MLPFFSVFPDPSCRKPVGGRRVFFWPKKGRWPKVRAAGDSVGMAIRPTKFWRVNSATKPSDLIFHILYRYLMIFVIKGWQAVKTETRPKNQLVGSHLSQPNTDDILVVSMDGIFWGSGVFLPAGTASTLE